MRRGFLYLVAIMDWHSRKVPSWRLSSNRDAGFCIKALTQALAKSGPPEKFRSNQGSQFTGAAFTVVVNDAGVKVSMDGRGCRIDKPMTARFRRSLKYACVFLNAFETGSEAREATGAWTTCYKEQRPHSSHGLLTPGEAYESQPQNPKAAASK